MERDISRNTVMTQAANDRDLIKRIASGEQGAVQVLFARFNVRVFRFILRFVRNEAIAEELMNEVFLDVWRQAGRYEGRSTVSTWVLAIAHNKAVSVMRKRSDEDLDDAMLGCLQDESDTPEVAAQKTSKGETMRACIEKLSEEHREVIDLVYYHEKSIKEVSEITGVPESTVKTRMFYARKKLSESMRKAGIDRGWP